MDLSLLSAHLFHDHSLTHLPHVYGFGVCDGREGVVDGGRLGGHGQQGGDPEGDPGRNGVRIEPEADPGDDDQHAARHVYGDQVVGELPLENEVHRETAVFAWKNTLKGEM